MYILLHFELYNSTKPCWHKYLRSVHEELKWKIKHLVNNKLRFLKFRKLRIQVLVKTE